MSRRRQRSFSRQFRCILGQPWDAPGRPMRHDYDAWTVTDDWPRPIPVTDAEIDLYEAYFSELFDEMFGPCR